MFDSLKKKMYFSKRNLMFKKGLLEGKIVPFDDEFYQGMNNTFFCSIPISMHIKYLRPVNGLGKCFDRSLYMFLALDNAVLVRGNNKDLEVILEQWSRVNEVPEIPGSYYFGRALDQAFWSVINDGINAKDAITKWSQTADAEIERKIEEYK